MFERRQIVAIKKCPNCTEQLPLSAVLCDGCDYNFLSEMVGHGQKLLPSPESPARETIEQSYAHSA
jgi:predicted nucleic acid binding AN1-type Zn finger protein